jgi:hypothetical protein
MSLIYYNEYHHLSTFCAFPEKYTLMPNAFKNAVARNMVKNSKHRDHLLNFEKALVDVLDACGFMSAKTCAKCDHLITPAAKMGLNKK